MACLVWDSPQGRKVFDLDRAVMVIGRDEASDLRLPDSTVSRRHALLQVDGNNVQITDLGSSTYTKINGAGLTRDMPSTLEPGDFVNVGGVVLTYHKTPPPAAAVPPPPAQKRAPAPRPPSPAPVPAAPSGGPWKWIALGLAFLLVGVTGALIALNVSGDEEPEKQTQTPVAKPREPSPQPKPEPKTDSTPKPKPKPEPKPKPDEAPAGSLPPAGHALVADFPDLVEIEGKTYFAVEVLAWDTRQVRLRGHDSRIYVLARAKVTKISDRGDVVRRVAVKRAGLHPDDTESRWQLALWCVARHVRSEARQLVAEVLRKRPEDRAAREMQAELARGS